ncbi:unnamed protein product [Tilletia controversa]|uniref:Uncharacterized protein n=3 Tax=Tilletia TaxID=13289 RepID=A0A9N8M8I2_9BASI|nr:hypothetical protein CF336_g8915 [Tilletia laevis]KAE8240245.1 hypothetical protein A4X03_0g8567 [Tilletia caries]CAD6934053.1 unnamed protein product [Tilletia controversa]CAD6964750.1 unnamed protein product [Tilletia laevis]CAD6976107.1 unnamed protein product [Tilletia controversa]
MVAHLTGSQPQPSEGSQPAARAMPSNQYPRTLTRPKRSPHQSLERSDPFVQTFHRFITNFSWLAIAVTVLCSLSDDLLGDSRTYGGKAAQMVPDSLAGLASIHKTLPKPACNPFALPGFVASSSGSLATWQLFSTSCQPSRFLPSIRAALGRPSSTSEGSVPVLSESQLSGVVANRSVLILGDAVDVGLVSHFCRLVQDSALVKVDKKHPWGDALTKVPQNHVWPNTAPIKVTGPSHQHEDPDAVLAQYCYVPHFDLLVTVVPTYGADYHDAFHEMKSYHSPGKYEHRLSDLVVPYLTEASKPSTSWSTHDLPKPRQSFTPDLTIVSSTFYDLALFALEDISNKGSLINDLTENRITEWRGRHVEMLAETNRKLKIHSGKKGGRGLAWRNLHIPNQGVEGGAAATVDWFLGSAENKNHPLFHVNRIAQLNAAWKSVVSPPEGVRDANEVIKGSSQDRSAKLPHVRGMNIADVLLGQDHNQQDRLVPGLSPGGALFAEMLLFELWSAVTNE